MNEFLKRKNIEFTLKRYGIDALGAMSLGLFVSLIAGLIISNIGSLVGELGLTSIGDILIDIGNSAKAVTGPAIGVAIAYGLKAPVLVMLSAAICGSAGNALGGPAGAFVATVFGVEFGKLVAGETKLDIIVTPFVTIIVGSIVGMFIGPIVDAFMSGIGEFIMWATELQPILMGSIVAMIMGIALTLPISSAAIAIMLNLSGLAAGAATVGCSAQMIGFAVASYQDNGTEGLLSQGLGTSMLQMPNIVKNPYIFIPPIVASAIIGPISTTIFHMESVASGAGMGTSGLVGQVATFEAMGLSFQTFSAVILLHFILPAIITLIVHKFLLSKGYVKAGDMKLNKI